MELEQDRIKNQQEFRALLEKHGISQAQAVVMINEESDHDISIRTLRSWLAKPTTISSRPCPPWAVTSLKRAIQNMS